MIIIFIKFGINFVKKKLNKVILIKIILLKV